MTPQPPHPACLEDARLLGQVHERRYKASGPGGQRRNKVETAVRLVHEPTGVGAEANERRSLEQNRIMALSRLRLRLALDVRTPVDLDSYRPSELWVARTRGAQLAVNPRHRDVPALLAEALDVLAALDDSVPEAAERLGVGSSRFLRVLKLEPASLAALNARRSVAGLKPYR